MFVLFRLSSHSLLALGFLMPARGSRCSAAGELFRLLPPRTHIAQLPPVALPICEEATKEEGRGPRGYSEARGIERGGS